MLAVWWAPMAHGATWYFDGDSDGVGRDDMTMEADTQPAGYAPIGGDCDDADFTNFPGNVEVCDGHDNDCDTLVDASDTEDLQPWYIDSDNDGFGKPEAMPFRGCEGPAGRADNDDDCNDENSSIKPTALEYCDGVDNNCDGKIDVDPDIPLEFFFDADGDGWGARASGVETGCEPPEGYYAEDADCDDDDVIFHPYAFEACTAPLADTNCDGAVGNVDNDKDGFVACEDCDDFEARAFPGAADTWYDGIIQDCDRPSDFDKDGDGFDSAEYGGDDCDDTRAKINPDAEEIPDNLVDEDCDGADLDLDTDDGLFGGGGGSNEGCSCDSRGGSQVGWLALMGLGLVRRRR